jgi:spore maturation protein CgeB
MLHIFQVFSSTAVASIPTNQTWYRNLYEPLIDLGHKVILFPAEEAKTIMQVNDAQRRAEFSQKLLDHFLVEHQRKPFHLFFAYLMDGMIDPIVIDEIRKTGVPTCNFSCNNIHQFNLVSELSPHFDFNLHAEREAHEKFLGIGATPLWWPMASNPNYFKPIDLPRTIDVSFVGANYALRSRYIEHLLKNKVDVHAFGPGWKNFSKSPVREFGKRLIYIWSTITAGSTTQQVRASTRLSEFDNRRHLRKEFPNNLHNPVSDEDMISLYSRSHISLGFLEVYDQHDSNKALLQHLHLREFEGPMAGALYCTGYMDELEEFFEPDKEVVVYRSQHELLDKVRFYLAHPQAANQIRSAGRNRALRDHTYHHRYRTLFEKIGLERHLWQS